jgi:nucleoid DNA-binding protein
MSNDLSVSKRKLWQYVNIKINRIIHHYHVFSVIAILFDEMISDLKAGKDIKIHNFGVLKLKKLKSRRHFNVVQQKVVLSKPHKILRFLLAPHIRKKIIDNLNFDKK